MTTPPPVVVVGRKDAYVPKLYFGGFMEANSKLNEAAAQLDALARNVDKRVVSPAYLGTTLRVIAQTIRENGGS